MAVDKNTGGLISLEEAKAFMADFAKNFPDQIKSQFIGSDNVEKILQQPDCVGLQIITDTTAKKRG